MLVLNYLGVTSIRSPKNCTLFAISMSVANFFF